eukprot:1375194-Amorphochlora_amoeboformis.AAC.1
MGLVYIYISHGIAGGNVADVLTDRSHIDALWQLAASEQHESIEHTVYNIFARYTLLIVIMR